MIAYTLRQRECMEYIKSYYDAEKRPPTYSELAGHLGCSIATAHGICDALTKLGAIERRNTARSIKILDPEFLDPQFQIIATVGEKLQSVTKTTINAFDVFAPGHCGVSVVGNSFAISGIKHGDILVLSKRDARHGDLVLGMIDDTPEILRWYGSDIEIRGVITAIVRRP